MNTIHRCGAAVLAAAITFTCLAGCARGRAPELVADSLFSLELGRLEDQVDLFQTAGSPMSGRTRITMRDGLFYVANGAAHKVMVFSSYGDLLFLLYDPATNPKPTLASAPTEPGTVSTRGAVEYPFQDLGEVAVSSEKVLYVEDAAPAARVVKDPVAGTLRRIVLRFDRRGAPLAPLGQEGPNGTPFPYIAALHVTDGDQLVVVCRLAAAWQVFWFSREGALLHQVEIDQAHLPPIDESGFTASLVNIVPDLAAPVLYLLLYYYPNAADKASTGVTARVHPLDLRTRQYGKAIELPVNPGRKEKVGFTTQEIARPPYDLLGTGSNGHLYLLGYTDSNLYNLIILGLDGRVRGRAYVVIEDSELTYRDTHLSPSGIIYGLLCGQAKADVSWWRSDRLLKAD
ncbi:MAG: hypothetical protein NTU62_18140 [Spirochaetes bacterium]|nr:hypothetical protein [Spirochaetota bacterium]